MKEEAELFNTKEYWIAKVHIQIWNEIWCCPSWFALFIAKRLVNDKFMEDIHKANIRLTKKINT